MISHDDHTTGDNGDTGVLTTEDDVGGFSYGLGVSLGILLLITTITLASYFCTRDSNRDDSSASESNNHRHRRRDSADIEAGIDEATLKTYPKLLYSQLERERGNSKLWSATTVSCCSICLGDYKAKDTIRLLPDCGHVFHLKCVDPWLRLHPTCPVCRTSPLPTPQSTPLSQATPLSAVVSSTI